MSENDIGTRTPDDTVPDSEDCPRIEIEVLHGSLDNVDCAVAVGHYEGSTLGGAEGFVDRLLGGRLTERQMLELYPGPVGSVEIVLAPDRKPRGVMILGLGPSGELTSRQLTEAVVEAALRLVLDGDDHAPPEDRERPTPRATTFCSVLIGTHGRLGLSIPRAVAAIVRGVIEADVILWERAPEDCSLIDRVQFVELYEERARLAARAVRDIESLIGPDTAEGFVLEPRDHLREIRGALPGASQDAGWDEGMWRRVIVEASEADDRGEPRLSFTTLGRRARAEAFDEAVQVRQIDAMIEDVVGSKDVQQVHNTLFELLIPNDFKDDLRSVGNLLLVVDPISACYPWEMLAPKDRLGMPEPLVRRRGVLRQLALPGTRTRVKRPARQLALVVGDPPGGSAYPRLPAARREAIAVADALESGGFEVRRIVAEADDDAGSWADITHALFESDYRIVHIAAHGMYDAENPCASGVVIGEGRFLTAATIRKLSVVPELVFLNCCHLGRTGDGISSAPRAAGSGDDATPRKLNALAASISAELMKIGVRAVVAAGWAIDDVAARAFAVRFYEQLLAGYAFGDAVAAAREAAADASRANTWAAFQCYGDPGFRLAAPRRARAHAPVSRSELEQRLTEIGVRAGAASRSVAAELRAELDALAAGITPQWRGGETDFRLGWAYSELGDYAQAVHYYRAALESWDAHAPIRLVEQLGNMEVRLAIQRVRAGRRTGDVTETPSQLFDAAERRYEALLNAVGETPERHAILGSLHKKRATIQKGRTRTASIERAAQAYGRAHELAAARDVDDRYAALNWITMTALRGPVTDAQRARLQRLAPRGEDRYGFWDRATSGDRLLTEALVNGGLTTVEDEVVAAYARAFESSSARERGSVLEHLDDLTELVADADAAEALRRIAERLREFSGTD